MELSHKYSTYKTSLFNLMNHWNAEWRYKTRSFLDTEQLYVDVDSLSWQLRSVYPAKTIPWLQMLWNPRRHSISSHGVALRWRHNEWDGVSNHQPHDCLFDRLSGRRSKKTSKPRVTGLCAGNSPGTGEFPAQMASNAETVSIWWRHHVLVVPEWSGFSTKNDKKQNKIKWNKIWNASMRNTNSWRNISK